MSISRFANSLLRAIQLLSAGVVASAGAATSFAAAEASRGAVKTYIDVAESPTTSATASIRLLTKRLRTSHAFIGEPNSGRLSTVLLRPTAARSLHLEPGDR